MNAVKRCLALIAATVLVGACSGDPTADLAGANLTIRATPGALWIVPNKLQPVLLEAIDATGAPAPGNWTATATGVATVVADTAFGHTSAGHIGQGRQFIVSAPVEGNGTVTFTGTGGSVTIPVRVAPSPVAFNATISTLNPALAATFDVTAPAGLRFTSGTAVTFIKNGVTPNNGLAAPTVVSMTADSATVTVLPAPGAAGKLKITGIASVQTPTLTTSALTVDSVTVPSLNSAPATFSANPVAENQPVTITLGTNFLLRPSSAFSIAGGPALGPVIVSRSADSTAVTLFPVPGFNVPIDITDIQFAPLPNLLLPLPTSGSLKTSSAVTAPGHVPHIAADDPMGVPPIGVALAPSTIGGITAYWDSTSFSAPDYTPDCGCGAVAQYVRFTATRTGNVNISIDWTGGTASNTDLDMVLLVDDGAYATAIPSTSGSAFVAATGAKPQAGTWALTSGTSYVIGIIDFGKSGFDGASVTAVPAGNTFRIVLTGQ